MSYLDNALDIALFVLIFSASLSLLNNPAIGVGSELGTEKNFETGTSQEEIKEGIAGEKDMTPQTGLDYFFKSFMIGIELLMTVIKIPFAIFSAVTTNIPGAIGIAFGTLFQIPADLIMLIGFAEYFKR